MINRKVPVVFLSRKTYFGNDQVETVHNSYYISSLEYIIKELINEKFPSLIQVK